jgi:opacity protein-like surface antigen
VHVLSSDTSFWRKVLAGSATGATNVKGGNLIVLTAGADLRVGVPIPASPVKPYAFAGLGWANLSVSNVTYRIGTLPGSLSPSSQNKLYWNIGVGADFGGPGLSFFVQARYEGISNTFGDIVDKATSLNLKSVGANFIPVTVGLKF